MVCPIKRFQSDSQFSSIFINLGIYSLIGAIFIILIAFTLNGLNSNSKVVASTSINTLNNYSNRVAVQPSEIDLGDGYNGKYYDGYNDPVQKSMAQELLGLYYSAVEKNQSFISSTWGLNKENVIEILIGMHIRETNTYSRRTPIKNNGSYEGQAPATYIPQNFVKWESYGVGKTIDGQTMNFTNYSWRDTLALRKRNNPENVYPVNYRSAFYYSDVNYSQLKSVAGALGPLQMIPATWHYNSQYLQGGKWSSSNPGWIKDIEKYVVSSKDNGRTNEATTSYDGDENDIFNFPDQLVGLLHWVDYYGKYEMKFSSNFSKTTDERTKLALVAMSYNRGAGGLIGALGNASQAFADDLEKIVTNETFYGELDSLYENQKGVGSADFAKVIAKWKEVGFTESGDYLTKTYPGRTVKLQKEPMVYGVTSVFAGRSWHNFLRGIAYGGTTKTPNAGGLNKVRYNYMTDTNTYRNTNQKVRTEALNDVMAIGYKGNIPIFDQSGEYMKKFRMLYPPDSRGERDFNRMACTVFAMTSIQHATGNYTLPKEHTYMDLDKNGKIDPVEFWGQGVGLAGQKAYNPRDFNYIPSNSSKSINTIGLGSLIQKLGYKVEFTNQGTKEGNQAIITRLTNGIPTTLRINSNRQIRGLVPKEDPNKIEYSKFDMYNRDNYKVGSRVMANLGHTVLGVDAKQFDGKWYISVVDSSYSHGGGPDSNLMWFEADSILADRSSMTYSIVGSTDPNWKPNTMNEEYIPKEEDLVGYVGIGYSEALELINGVEMYYEDFQTGRLLNNSDSNVVRIQGKFKTTSRNGRLYLHIGEIGSDIIALEFSNITNPRINATTGTREYTELFNLTPGNRAMVRLATISSSNEIYYDAFFDE